MSIASDALKCHGFMLTSLPEVLINFTVEQHVDAIGKGDSRRCKFSCDGYAHQLNTQAVRGMPTWQPRTTN